MDGPVRKGSVRNLISRYAQLDQPSPDPPKPVVRPIRRSGPSAIADDEVSLPFRPTLVQVAPPIVQEQVPTIPVFQPQIKIPHLAVIHPSFVVFGDKISILRYRLTHHWAIDELLSDIERDPTKPGTIFYFVVFHSPRFFFSSSVSLFLFVFKFGFFSFVLLTFFFYLLSSN